VAVSHRKSWWECFELPHDCRICAREPEAKEAWGCTEPSEELQLWIPCESCDGLTEGCQTCAGQGWEPIHRCPLAILDPLAVELVALHRHWPGTLPYEGGVYEQPALYVEAMRYLDRREAEFESRVRQIEEQQRRPR